MKTVGVGVIALLVGAVLAAGVVLALDDDDSATDETVSADSPPPCSQLIPDAAVASLGWSAPSVADEHVERCERRDDAAGEVTVGTRALGSLEDDDRAAAAQQEYDAQCTALEGPDGSATVERPPTWLTDDSDVCAQLPEGGQGVAEMFVLTSEDVVQIRVVSRQAVDEADFHDALNTLVDAAVEVY